MLTWTALGVWLLGGSAWAQANCRADWPLWQEFRRVFVQADGRVLNTGTDRLHSSSEGQSYAMLFALIAGDRDTFDRLWQWSVDNLFAGRPDERLPAWLWGRDDDGRWRILDDNSASDADVWFVYALLEADRLWQVSRYRQQALTLLARIEAEEVADIPGLGWMLLPGRDHFVHDEASRWRLNPSYLPIPLFRRLERASPDGPWGAVARNTVRLMQAVTPHGLAPDWAVWQSSPDPTFMADPLEGDVGSYDAIRTYLWAAVTSPEDSVYSHMLTVLRGMTAVTRQAAAVPPERVDTRTGEISGTAPFGFSAALMPYFKVTGEGGLLRQQRLRVRSLLHQALQPESLARFVPYYDTMLTLFGAGWTQGRYRFERDGSLYTTWKNECFASSQ